jgi:uncharacterized protein (TIGR03083 family)
MTYRSPSPGNLPSDTLLLRTRGECDLDPWHLLEVFGGQRARFVAALRELDPQDWAAPTRCADWTVHEVVRHLGDSTAVAVGTGDRTIDLAGGFDPRVTPRQWLAASAGESPAATLGRLTVTSASLLNLARARLAHGRRFDVALPYGPMDWTVLLLHALWDSWIHERDVLLALGAEHPANDDATGYAAAYGVFIAAAVASMFGEQVREQLTLGGDGGGVFDLDCRDAVTLTVNRAEAAGRPAAEVTDALAGRAPADVVLGDLPPTSRAALSHLANFFNSPVG